MKNNFTIEYENENILEKKFSYKENDVVDKRFYKIIQNK